MLTVSLLSAAAMAAMIMSKIIAISVLKEVLFEAGIWVGGWLNAQDWGRYTAMVARFNDRMLERAQRSREVNLWLVSIEIASISSLCDSQR